MKIKKTILFILCFNGLFLFSQEKSTEILITNFFAKYQKSPNSALSYLFGTNNAYYEKNKETIDKFIKGYTEEFLPKVGKYYGYNKISKEEVFYSSLIKYQFALNYDDLPILFELTLYKPKDEWLLYNFSYKTNYGLPEAAPVKQ